MVATAAVPRATKVVAAGMKVGAVVTAAPSAAVMVRSAGAAKVADPDADAACSAPATSGWSCWP